MDFSTSDFLLHCGWPYALRRFEYEREGVDLGETFSRRQRGNGKADAERARLKKYPMLAGAAAVNYRFFVGHGAVNMPCPY